MGKQKFLGELEMIVLAALLRLDDDAYGSRIIDVIAEQAERNVSIGALYATLKRLEQKGLVTVRQGEATAVRGGRAKRYFKITGEGQRQMQRSLNSLRNLLVGTPIGAVG